MTLFVELIPIIAFFVAYQWSDIYVATIAMMATSMLQIIISLLQKKPIDIERWISVITLVLLGSITLIFKNTHFIKWKPTIGYGIVAATFALTPHRHNNITLLEKTVGNTLHLSKHSWAQLNSAWVVFFCLLGFLNLAVAYTTDTDTWVYFKFFGLLGLSILFIIGQIIYLAYFNKNQPHHESIHR